MFEGIKNGFNNLKNSVVETHNQIKQNLETATANIDAMNKATYSDQSLKDTMIQNPKVLAEHLLRRDCISGSLTIPVRNYNQTGAVGKTYTVPFYMSGDFNLSFGNQWGDALDLSELKSLSQWINGFHAVTGSVAQVSMQSEAMSAQVWQGSTFGGFNIDCLFICTNRRINPLKILNILTATCLPTKLCQQPTAAGGAIDVAKNSITGTVTKVSEFIGDRISGAKDAVNNLADGLNHYITDMGMIAPLNYGLDPGKDSSNPENPLPNSTVALQIGEYFRADKLLVESISSVVLSKEIVGPPNWNRRSDDLYNNYPEGEEWGFPLYMKCQLKLKPHSLMHFTKWQEYFKNPRDRADYPTIGA